MLVDRLWPRGARKEDGQVEAVAEGHRAERGIARRWFDHDPIRFAEFSLRYRAQLSANKDAVGRIDDFVKAGPVTLLYAARDTEHNHAHVLADYLKARALGRSKAPVMETDEWTMNFAAPKSGAPLSSRLTQKETGIDETMIETLIRAFYARVREDPLLAPSSNRAFPSGSRISTTCSRSGRR